MIAKIKAVISALGMVRKAWPWAVLAILSLGWLWTVASLHKERASHERTKAQYAHERATAAAAAQANERRNRELETKLNHATHASAEAQRELAAERRARADDARLADGRVRSAAKTYAAAAGARCANPTAAGNQPTAAEALNLLAGLLDRVASRTTGLAEFTEASHAAASACAADYDRARQALSAQ